MKPANGQLACAGQNSLTCPLAVDSLRVYCLRTNETGRDSGRLWRTYIMLTDLEAVFRNPNPKTRNYLCELITLYSLAKVSPTYLICSAVCAALTLHRTSDFPSGAAGGRIRFT